MTTPLITSRPDKKDGTIELMRHQEWNYQGMTVLFKTSREGLRVS